MLVKNGYASGLDWMKELRLSKLAPPAYSTTLGAMFNVDAIEVLRTIPSDSLDLVMTSPPFALTRSRHAAHGPRGGGVAR